MRKLAVFAVLAMGAFTAQATPINGSLVVGSFGATINGSNLLTATVYDPVGQPDAFAGTSTGNYGIISVGTGITGGVVNRANLNAFSFTIGTYGSFVASSGLEVSRTENFADFFFLGNFTPGAAFLSANPTAETTSSSFRVSLNQSGSSVSYGGTLASPPQSIPGIPEPGTVATGLAGLGIVGVMALRRRQA